MGGMAPLHLMDSKFAGAAWELACDEALLEAGEANELPPAGLLRFWEPDTAFVVLGYANKAALEVNSSTSVPVFRRCSGGGSVLQGPGCLNYSLIVPITAASELVSITQTNCFIMKRHRDALAAFVQGEITVEGYTDLALDGRKFSGNSQRRKNRWLLFHGTFLLHCNADLMDKVLLPPPRQPAYRKGRGHSEFVAALGKQAMSVKEVIARAWNATEPFQEMPLDRIDTLLETKYLRKEWNLRT